MCKPYPLKKVRTCEHAWMFRFAIIVFPSSGNRNLILRIFHGFGLTFGNYRIYIAILHDLCFSPPLRLYILRY